MLCAICYCHWETSFVLQIHAALNAQKILHINFYSDKINCKIDKFRCELTSPMIDMATLFVVVIFYCLGFLFTHSIDTSKVQQICDAWQLTSLRQLQFSNSSNWIQVTNRHSHSRSAQISSLWSFSFFHLFIIIMDFLLKKSLCNLIGIFRNLLITRVEFLFIQSFSWYFAFCMDARNCVVC